MNAVTDAAAPPRVLREDADGIATVTLNRPDSRNPLSRETMTALQETFDAIAKDENVKVVILTGAGPVFCAGHDLKEIGGKLDHDAYLDIFGQCSRLMLTINRLPQPVVAKIRGIATAAGCQLAASTDLAFAAKSARFQTPGVHIGLFCSTPMVPLSRAVGPKAAMEMLLTGDMFDADFAERTGLINRAVADDDLDAAVAECAAKIADKSPLIMKIGKEAFYRQLEMGLADAYEYATGVAAGNMMARDAAEGIGAFLEKRKPVWSGS